MKITNHRGDVYGTRDYDLDYPDWLAGSCGARFTTNQKVDLTRIHNGVKLIAGHVGKPTDNPVYAISHIQTKAGPLTVGIRRKVRA